MKEKEVIEFVLSRMAPEFVKENLVNIWVPEFYTENMGCATIAEGKAKVEKLILDPETWDYAMIDEYEVKKSTWSNEYDAGIGFDQGEEDVEAIEANYDKKITQFTFYPGGELGEAQDNIRIEAWVDHTGTKVIAWGTVQD
jgi:hypothetical protein